MDLKTVDIKSICIRDDLGTKFYFKQAAEYLERARAFLLEIDELSTPDLITEDDDRTIKQRIDGLIELLGKIESFDVTQPNSSDQHKRLETQSKKFASQVLHDLRGLKTYLRQEASRSGGGTKNLEKQQKETIQAKREYQTLIEAMDKELSEIRSRRSELEKTQGEFVAIALGKDFGDQAETYGTKAKEWLDFRSKWLWALFFVVGANLLFYLYLFITNKVGWWPHIVPKDFFTPQYGLVKIALLLLLSYVVGFCSRNYNINSGLSATNRHRKNVAETLLNALSSQLTDEAKAELTRSAASEMFKHLPVGYISKEHQNDSGPILGVVERVLPKVKE